MTQSSSRGGQQGQSRRASSPKAYPPRPALVSNRIIIAQMMRASLHEEPDGLAGVLWTPFYLSLGAEVSSELGNNHPPVLQMLLYRPNEIMDPNVSCERKHTTQTQICVVVASRIVSGE